MCAGVAGSVILAAWSVFLKELTDVLNYFLCLIFLCHFSSALFHLHLLMGHMIILFGYLNAIGDAIRS
jgi:hypothetical protein